MRTAVFTLELAKPFCNIKNRAMPINRNRIVQTGPKIRPGGLKAGFLIVKYHVLTELTVNIEPMIPASWQITTEIINKSILFMRRTKETHCLIKRFAIASNSWAAIKTF